MPGEPPGSTLDPPRREPPPASGAIGERLFQLVLSSVYVHSSLKSGSFESCSSSAASASPRPFRASATASQKPPSLFQRCSSSSTTADVSINASTSAASGSSSSSASSGPAAWLSPERPSASAARRRSSGSPLSAMCTSRWRTERIGTRVAELDHVQVLGRRRVLERPHDVLADVEPDSRARVEAASARRARRAVSPASRRGAHRARARLAGARCRWEPTRCSQALLPEPAL